MHPHHTDETVPVGKDKIINVGIDANDDTMTIDESAITRIFFVGSKSAGCNCEKKTHEYHVFVK